MIGKILKVCGVLFIVLVVGMAAMLFWAHSTGSRHQQAFFDVVAKEDPDALLAMMVDKVAAECDPPMLRVWMRAINDRLGAYEGLSASDFETNTQSTEAGQVTESRGTAKFTKGEAKVRLTLLDDKFVGFSVESDAMADWLVKPATALYHERATKLIRLLADQQIDDAMAMMHENLQKQLGRDQLQAGMKRFAEAYGSCQSVEVVDDQFIEEAETRGLMVQLKCVCEKQTLPATVRFEFNYTRGHILGFALPAEN